MEDYCDYQQRLIRTFTPALNLRFWDIPGITKMLGNTYIGVLLKSKVLCREKRPLEALLVLINALKTERFWHNHADKWWKLMNQAVLIARDLFSCSDHHQTDPLHQLINLSQHAPQPWQGREVAYCFALLSLWSYQEGRTQKAIDKIRAAIHADPGWGYAEYLLGWYGLLLQGIDPVEHFVRAIQIEGKLRQSFAQDPLIARFPEIRESVESLLHQGPNSIK